uniref:PX domain containing 1 n=1 Tax=Mandrillus leucophaeus TaxID=9568 RepID=A0A2K5ZGL8_MANLE
ATLSTRLWYSSVRSQTVKLSRTGRRPRRFVGTCCMLNWEAISWCAFLTLSISVSILGLVAIKEAHDIETRLNEVEKLLKTIISMPCKYSRSEVVLTFFERSPLDQVLKNDNVHKIQPSFQSPVKISEIMRSNGFCLANTETIVIDHSIPNGRDQHLGMDPTEHLFENGSEFPSELEDGDDPAAYVTNLSYYHLVPFETDILD